MDLLILSWSDIYNICIKLAEKIVRDDYKIELIIGVSRGGLIPSRIFSDIFNIDNIIIVTAKYYTNINERLDEPIIHADMGTKDVRDKNMLIVDDVVDTGNTMLSLINILDSPNIKTLTLYKKPRSIFEPDYYAEISDKWIIFPWERYEMLRSVIEYDPSIADIEKIRNEDINRQD